MIQHVDKPGIYVVCIYSRPCHDSALLYLFACQFVRGHYARLYQGQNYPGRHSKEPRGTPEICDGCCSLMPCFGSHYPACFAALSPRLHRCNTMPYQYHAQSRGRHNHRCITVLYARAYTSLKSLALSICSTPFNCSTLHYLSCSRMLFAPCCQLLYMQPVKRGQRAGVALLSSTGIKEQH